MAPPSCRARGACRLSGTRDASKPGRGRRQDCRCPPQPAEPGPRLHRRRHAEDGRLESGKLLTYFRGCNASTQVGVAPGVDGASRSRRRLLLAPPDRGGEWPGPGADSSARAGPPPEPPALAAGLVSPPDSTRRAVPGLCSPSLPPAPTRRALARTEGRMERQ